MGFIDPDKRKTKRDKKAKRKYRAYKRGGKFRGTDVQEGGKGVGGNKK